MNILQITTVAYIDHRLASNGGWDIRRSTQERIFYAFAL